MRILTTIALLLLISGCNGQIKEFTDSANYPTEPSKTRGLRVYMPAPMLVTMRTTTVTQNKIKSYICTGQVFQQIQIRPDYSQPLRIYYEPGLFETVKFGVTMTSEGVLTNVNGEGTPAVSAITTAIPATITAVAALAVVPSVPGAPKPLCTGDPVIEKIEKCVQTGGTICSVQK